MMGRVRQSTRSNSRCRGRNTALCAGAYAYLGRHSSSGLVTVCNCPKFYLSILLQRFPGVLFSTTVQDLGVTLDQEPTLSRHVGSVCRSCFYHLRQIRSVPRSLTSKAARTLMHSFIHSGHFYSAPSSPLPLRGAPDYSTDTASEFYAEAHRQLQVKDLPKVPT